MVATLLALDAGTTGVTAVLFDERLVPVARSYREFPQHFPAPGRVEHEAKEILAAVDQVLAELLGQPGAGDVRALGITNQRETVFALERASGRALGPGIVWQDRRTAPRCEELRREGREALVQRKTGLVLDPYFSGTKVEWMLANDPGLARRADAGEILFATVDTLVLGHLTGGATRATDPTNASRTMLYDIDARAWDPELCGLFGVRPGWLADVLPSAGDFGTTVPERTGGVALPVRGVAGDQQAALFGQACVAPGTLKATYGTGSFLLLNTGPDRVDSERGLLTTLAADRGGAPVYALEGSVFVCGAAVQWLRDELGFFGESAEIEGLARTVPDAGGVHLVPAFAGLGAPYWDAEARGAILGLTRGTSRAHIARATLEGIAFQNAELVEVLRADSGLPVEEMLVDGGAAANDLLMQMQADLAGLTVLRPASVEATARGAAALAGTGVGLLDPVEALRSQGEPARFEPELTPPEREERLSGWRTTVARIRTPSIESGPC